MGNENNYGLFWRGAETEDVPFADRKSTKSAYHLYKLFNDVAIELKQIDNSHPIAICNGDLLFSEIIEKECKNVDILGINAYRGLTFTDLYSRVKKELIMPVILTEFGSDAYNTIANQEDQEYQAKVLLSNWKEIYNNADESIAEGLGFATICKAALLPFSNVVHVQAFPGAQVSKVIGAFCANANDEVSINNIM